MYKDELHYNNFSTINEQNYQAFKSLSSLFVSCTKIGKMLETVRRHPESCGIFGVCQ